MLAGASPHVRRERHGRGVEKAVHAVHPPLVCVLQQLLLAVSACPPTPAPEQGAR